MMSDNDKQLTSSKSDARSGETNEGRRRFLFLIPAGIFAAIAATLVSAAARMLRPHTEIVEGAGSWTPLAPASEFAGDRPVMRRVVSERGAGWTMAIEESVVFVLPYRSSEVVSAVCPHQGCEVAWRDEARDFFCPCHDSRFAPDGAVLSGPAQRNLTRLPARVENGVLQVQPRTPATDAAQQSTEST